MRSLSAPCVSTASRLTLSNKGKKQKNATRQVRVRHARYVFEPHDRRQGLTSSGTGKVYKVAEDRSSTPKMEVYASFGGLLMMLKVSYPAAW